MTELKVGILALATVIAVVFMSFQVTKNQSGFGDYVTYHTVLDDASGIFTKTPIKVAGIPAGRIKKIELQGNKALVTFEVLETVKVTAGSKLKIKAVGFLGDKFIEIEVNTSSNKVLPAGAELEASTLGGMEGLMSNSNKLLDDLTILVKSLKQSLVPAGEEPPVTTMIRDMKTILKDLTVISQETKEMIIENKKSVNSIIANMRKAMEDLAYELDASENESIMRKLKDIGPIMHNIKEMSSDMRQIVADLKAGKGTMGKFLVDDEIADQVRQTMASVQKIVGKADAVRADLEVFTGYDTEADVVAEFGLKLITSPERFYNIGVISSDIGAKTKTYTETTTDGVRSVEDKVEYKKDTYRFTATMGRQLGNWAIRGGIIESAAGLGIDYSYLPWGWTTSADVFDSKYGDNLNLRLTTEVRLWNVFYGRLRGNDLSQKATRSFSFSLGLRFTDDDLKSLMGVML